MINKTSLAFIAVALVQCRQTGEIKRPNLVIILADDLGYNDLSSYRTTDQDLSPKPPTTNTPNIDRLAVNGMKFSSFYCGAAVSSPSRAALSTGRNASRTGIYNWIPPNTPMHLRSEEITIAEMLKEVGYVTGHFGKWHLTSEGSGQPLPEDQGFDYSFFTYNNANPSHKDPVNFFRNEEPAGELKGYSCQLVVDEAIGWLSTRSKKDEPFYINVWFNEPHEKVAAPEEYTEHHTYNKDYYGSIENMDAAVGRLIAYLEDNQLINNTIVIFTSDNGSQVYGSNDPLRGEKCFNFEGGIRVPFIISWPGQVPANTTSDFTGSITDILPSIAGMTGANAPGDRIIDGIDISEVFLGKAGDTDRSSPVFFYRYFHDPILMLREREWVLLGYEELIPLQEQYDEGNLARLKPVPGEPSGSMWGFQPRHMEYIEKQSPQYFELYNIREDPRQEKNLAETYPDIVNRLKKQMLNLYTEMVAEGGNWYKDN